MPPTGLGVPMTMDERYQHSFPWDLRISNEEFLSWEIGAFQHRTYTSETDGQPVTYYLIRYPPLVTAPNTWRLTICPYWSQPSLYNISRNVARLYNVTELMQQLFTNAETHPIVHAHETALYLLSEQDYVTHAQILLNNLGVDESAESVLVTFPSLSLNDETAPLHPQAPTQPPTQPPTRQRQQFAGLQRGFFTNTQPRPLLLHHSDLTDIEPRNASNIPLVGVHLRRTTGDPIALAIADAEVLAHFNDMRHFHEHRAD